MGMEPGAGYLNMWFLKRII